MKRLEKNKSYYCVAYNKFNIILGFYKYKCLSSINNKDMYNIKIQEIGMPKWVTNTFSKNRIITVKASAPLVSLASSSLIVALCNFKAQRRNKLEYFKRVTNRYEQVFHKGLLNCFNLLWINIVDLFHTVQFKSFWKTDNKRYNYMKDMIYHVDRCKDFI